MPYATPWLRWCSRLRRKKSEHQMFCKFSLAMRIMSGFIFLTSLWKTDEGITSKLLRVLRLIFILKLFILFS